MLTVDPTQRITIENLALHPWVARASVSSSPLIALYAPRLECGSGKQTVDWEGTDDSVGGIGLAGTQPDDTTLDAVVELGFQKAFAEFCIPRGGHTLRPWHTGYLLQLTNALVSARHQNYSEMLKRGFANARAMQKPLSLKGPNLTVLSCQLMLQTTTWSGQ